MSEQLQLGVGSQPKMAVPQRPPFARYDELDAKVEAVLRANLEPRQKEILRVIAGHKGAAQAIRSGAIAEALGMLPGEVSRREITKAVEDFVLFYKLPIGALRMFPYGYFLIVSAEDLELALQPLAGEFYSLMRRMRALGSKERVAELYDQLRLKLDSEVGCHGATEAQR